VSGGDKGDLSCGVLKLELSGLLWRIWIVLPETIDGEFDGDDGRHKIESHLISGKHSEDKNRVGTAFIGFRAPPTGKWERVKVKDLESLPNLFDDFDRPFTLL
jgi:hypothetical protein